MIEPRCNSFAVISLLALALCGCKNVPMLPGLSPYTIEIQQGNVVTQDMVSKLKPGMTRQQVRFVMGTPPIVDIFHSDRWDYVYYVNKRNKVVEYRRLVLLFDGETLKRIEGDVIPAGGTPERRGSNVSQPADNPTAGAQPADKPAPAVQPADKPAADPLLPPEQHKLSKPGEPPAVP